MTPPLAILEFLLSYEPSPLVQIRLGPLGSNRCIMDENYNKFPEIQKTKFSIPFLLSLKNLSNSPAFFLKVSKSTRASTSIAIKKCPRGIGCGLPVSRLIPQTSGPNGPL